MINSFYTAESDPWAEVEGLKRVVVHECDGYTDDRHKTLRLTPREAVVLAHRLLDAALGCLLE